MSYIDTTQYDFKDPCAYPITPADGLNVAATDIYNTRVLTVGADATLARYTGVTINDSAITPITKGTQSSQSGVTKKPTYGSWTNHTIECEALDESYTVASIATNKYPDVISVYIYGGQQLTPDLLNNVTKSDFNESGHLVLTYKYGGKTYFNFDSSEIVITPTGDISSHSYSEGADYTINFSKTTADGKDTITVDICVMPESTLATDLAADGVMEISTLLYQSNIELVRDVDYSVSCVPHGGTGSLATAPDAVITPIIPAGYAGISAAIRINTKQTVFSGPCDGITMCDTPASGPRIATVWTSGTFKKADLANYLPIFDTATNMKFI